MRLPLSLLTLLCATALPAMAQEVPLERPSDCQPVLTVQFRGCEVQTFLECQMADTLVYRYELYEAEGPSILSHSTIDGFLIGMVLPVDDVELIGILEGAEATPRDEILSTGRSFFRQNLEIRYFGNMKEPATFESRSERTNDVALGLLQVHEFESVLNPPPPAGKITIRGKSYYHPELEIYIEGESTVSGSEEVRGEMPHKPARLIYPGEPGFDTTTPEFDCNQLSLLSPQPASRHS